MTHPENTNADQPLFPLPGSSERARPQLDSVDGRPLHEVTAPEELVAVSFGDGKREILVPAGNVLAHDGTPIMDSPDGAIQHLDPNQNTVKFLGEAVAHSVIPEDPRLER